MVSHQTILRFVAAAWRCEEAQGAWTLLRGAVLYPDETRSPSPSSPPCLSPNVPVSCFQSTADIKRLVSLSSSSSSSPGPGPGHGLPEKNGFPGHIHHLPDLIQQSHHSPSSSTTILSSISMSPSSSSSSFQSSSSQASPGMCPQIPLDELTAIEVCCPHTKEANNQGMASSDIYRLRCAEIISPSNPMYPDCTVLACWSLPSPFPAPLHPSGFTTAAVWLRSHPVSNPELQHLSIFLLCNAPIKLPLTSVPPAGKMASQHGGDSSEERFWVRLTCIAADDEIFFFPLTNHSLCLDRLLFLLVFYTVVSIWCFFSLSSL